MTRTPRTTHCPPAARRILLLIVLLTLLGLFAAQSASAASPSASAAGSTFRVGWLLDPDTLNPWLGYLGQDYVIYHLNYDYLVGYDPKTFAPRPELATSWSVSPDGKTWTFKIRDGVKWQDGEPLTARDVAFTYNYIIDNQISLFAAYTDGIIRAEAVDDATCVITCSRPKANMISNIVTIIPEHVWAKIPVKEATTSFQNPPPIVGSGPFQVVERQKGKFIKLKANKSYWGGAPKVDELIFEYYTNADTMSADLKSGVIDAAVELPAAQIGALGSTPGLTTIKGTHWRFNELGFNCYDSPDSLGNPVLRDQAFREAFNYAIDREKIASVAFFGQAAPGQTLLPPYSAYTWQPPAGEAYTYDPAKASAMLEAAGYKDVNGDGLRETKQGKPLDLRLYVTTDSTENQTAAKLIAGWFKDVGVKVSLRVVDSGALIDAQYNFKGDVYAPDFDMFIWYWTQDPDPSLMLGVPTRAQIGAWNDTLWWTPEFDKLNVAQDSAVDVPTRVEYAQQMQQIAWRETPYLVFAYPYQLEGYNSGKWQGVVTSPSNVEGYDGSAFYNYVNVDTYRFVTAQTAATTSSSGANTTVLIIVGGSVAVVVIGLIVLLMRRRAARSVEE
jgi:peptide/nickel transport system substrate-binding protein